MPYEYCYEYMKLSSNNKTISFSYKFSIKPKNKIQEYVQISYS